MHPPRFGTLLEKDKLSNLQSISTELHSTDPLFDFDFQVLNLFLNTPLYKTTRDKVLTISKINARRPRRDILLCFL